VLPSGNASAVHYVLLDDESFEALEDIARREGTTAGQICRRAILKRAPDVTPTRALRAFILQYFREAATEQGHKKAGHGSLG
jgi:predicted DNA-binding ribbon-helix-helix protein